AAASFVFGGIILECRRVGRETLWRVFVLRYSSLLSACHRDIQAESDDDDDSGFFCGGAPLLLASAVGTLTCLLFNRGGGAYLKGCFVCFAATLLAATACCVFVGRGGVPAKDTKVRNYCCIVLVAITQSNGFLVR
ncbi:unnamed protein product, partial [Ectocarpus sp. 6 AP-2014]